jgi:5'-methylthioadenosine phosphorylase
MADLPEVQVGVIGGSGIDRIDGLEVNGVVGRQDVESPFGQASSDYIIGELGGVSVAFLERHGKGHPISPTELPNLANIWGFKRLGVKRLVSVSAVGSLEEDYAPGELAIPDDLIDRTTQRPRTFSGNGFVAHVSMANPYCNELRDHLTDATIAATKPNGWPYKVGGTLVVIEGPQFGTAAESRLYKQWGAKLIGMTALPEAYLAREAGLCYATLALVTDYDAWRPQERGVEGHDVIKVARENAARATRVLHELIPLLGQEPECGCSVSIDAGLFTDRSVVPDELVSKLSLILPKAYVDGRPAEA